MPVFGPVRSRRLGLSLGVELVPSKICSMDCVYCEVGRTTRLTLKRDDYLPLTKIEEALRRALAEKTFDVVTLTGSGEPTLNVWFPKIVELVRELTPKPIAVLTNSTTLSVPEVFSALCKVDYVLASLDAVNPEAFRRVNRPVPELDPEKLVEDLIRLREAMSGELWLEILLVKDFNDRPEDLRALSEAVSRIKPHRVQLNTVVRPPADPRARPLSRAELLALTKEFTPLAEIISYPPPNSKEKSPLAVSEEELLAYLSRRPAPVEELAQAFEVDPEKLKETLALLLKRGRLKEEAFSGRIFYRA